MLSLLIGSIKREHGPIHSPVAVHVREKRTKETKQQQTKTKTAKKRQPRRMDKTALVELQQLVCWKRGLAWSNHKPNTSPCKSQEKMQKTIPHVAETQSPPSQDPGDHNEKPIGHNRHLHPSEIAQCNMNWDRDQQQAPCRGEPSKNGNET